MTETTAALSRAAELMARLDEYPDDAYDHPEVEAISQEIVHLLLTQGKQ